MDSLLKFIRQSEKDLNGNENYCIVVYKTLGPLNREVALIYKDIKEFRDKITDDVKKVNSMYGIDFQVWIFD